MRGVWRLQGKRNALPRAVGLQAHFELSRHVDFSACVLVREFGLSQNSILHVGAHVGQEVPEYLSLGFAQVLALEPQPNVFLDLQRRFGHDPRVIVRMVAAGSKSGLAPMFVADNEGQSSSLLRPMLHLHDAPHVGFESEITVEIVRLDEILPTDHPYSFWVLDAQGYELEVLKGSGDRLARVNYLFTETNRGDVYESCAQIQELDELLMEHGLFRLLTRWWGSWGDALYARYSIQRS